MWCSDGAASPVMCTADMSLRWLLTAGGCVAIQHHAGCRLGCRLCQAGIYACLQVRVNSLHTISDLAIVRPVHKFHLQGLFWGQTYMRGTPMLHLHHAELGGLTYCRQVSRGACAASLQCLTECERVPCLWVICTKVRCAILLPLWLWICFRDGWRMLLGDLHVQSPYQILVSRWLLQQTM